MKVLFTFAESDYTGAGRMGHSYMQALRKCGHNVIAVIGPFSHEGERRLGDVLEETDFEYIEMNLFNSFWNYRNVLRLKRLIATYAVDCIVSMNQADVKVTAISAKLLSIKYLQSLLKLP